jgi:hypothetical protein
MLVAHDPPSEMQELDAVEAQLAAIRLIVARDRGATVGCDELRLLRPDHLTVSDQFMRIADIARKEGWSFAFLPNGTVRFGTFARRSG